MNHSIRIQGPVSSQRFCKLLNNRETQHLLFCLLITFAWGIIAHAYGFFQDSFSHDSLNALYAHSIETNWKIQLGRILVPTYLVLVRGRIALPWLSGMLALLWIGLSVYLVTRMLGIKSKVLITFTAGLFVTNLTVSSIIATYNNDLDVDMLALLAASASAYFWNKQTTKSLLLGSLLSLVSLCLYQSYISVTITLIMFVCILNLLNKDGFSSVMKRGLKAIGMLLASALLYILMTKMVSVLNGINMDTGNYNSIGNVFSNDLKSLIRGVLFAYLGWGYALLKSETAYPQLLMIVLRLILFLATAVSILTITFKGSKYDLKEKLLILVLCVLLPVGMNFSCVWSQGTFHYLMAFAIWFTYLFVLLTACRMTESSSCSKGHRTSYKKVVFVLTALMIWGNIQASNTMYLKKDLEEEATLSLMTRVVARMEVDDNYIPHETPVVFVGLSNLIEPIPGMEFLADTVGVRHTSPISVATATSYFNTYDAYFKYILRYPIQMCNSETWNEMQADPRVQNMPSFPAENSMQLIDGIYIIKMG